jgi:hypothetical protein
VLSAISPANIMGQVKKLAGNTSPVAGIGINGSSNGAAASTGSGASPVRTPAVATTTATTIEDSTSPARRPSPVAGADLEAVSKERINQILAEHGDDDDEDSAIAAALSKATNLVEEVRGGSSAMSK